MFFKHSQETHLGLCSSTRRRSRAPSGGRSHRRRRRSSRTRARCATAKVGIVRRRMGRRKIYSEKVELVVLREVGRGVSRIIDGCGGRCDIGEDLGRGEITGTEGAAIPGRTVLIRGETCVRL